MIRIARSRQTRSLHNALYAVILMASLWFPLASLSRPVLGHGLRRSAENLPASSQSNEQDRFSFAESLNLDSSEKPPGIDSNSTTLVLFQNTPEWHDIQEQFEEFLAMFRIHLGTKSVEFMSGNGKGFVVIN